MIVSFHPCIEADKNIICAGRDPNSTDLAWIKQADAVILAQGCRKSLYEMAKAHCVHVFPDYDVKFAFPGKIGQARLFQKVGALFPKTETFLSIEEFYGHGRGIDHPVGFEYPLVFKFDWGGESDNVYLIKTADMLASMLEQAGKYEKTGQSGFLIQKFIPAANRSLRVAVIGEKLISYWRVQPDKTKFTTSVAKGAVIDETADPEMQQAGADAVKWFCAQTHINLAGFDMIFSEAHQEQGPFFLEINYFFGRTGLGSSESFYPLLKTEIDYWMDRIGILK